MRPSAVQVENVASTTTSGRSQWTRDSSSGSDAGSFTVIDEEMMESTLRHFLCHAIDTLGGRVAGLGWRWTVPRLCCPAPSATAGLPVVHCTASDDRPAVHQLGCRHVLVWTASHLAAALKRH